SSLVPTFPVAQRTGMAIGAANGISESATEYVDAGLPASANTDRYATISRNITGCCAWRASCSLEDMAPTAANIAEYRKNPPRKNVRNTTIVAAVMFGNWNAACCAVASGGARSPTRVPTCDRTTAPPTTHIRNWKIETAPTPTTLPSMSWKGRSEETSTSTMRVVFSSSTELITFTP